LNYNIFEEHLSTCKLSLLKEPTVRRWLRRRGCRNLLAPSIYLHAPSIFVSVSISLPLGI
jgi:hypothetical protein